MTQGHASHEACELKYYEGTLDIFKAKVTPRMRRVS